jgi:hypothetical protein
LAEESIARDALTYMIMRYRDTKSTSPSQNREVSLACAGEILKDFAEPYFAVIEGQHLNVSLVSSYNETKQLIQSHEADVENVYPKLRDNLTPAIDQVISSLRDSNQIPKVPQVTLDNYGQKEMVADFVMCNSPNFVSTVARLAPLNGTYDTYVEAPTFRVPIGQDDGQYGTGDGAPVAPVKQVVKQKLSQWLYEIYRR